MSVPKEAGPKTDYGLIWTGAEMGGGQNEAESGSFRGNSGYPEGGALMPFIILARPSEYNIHKVLQELSAPMLTRDAYVSMRRAHGSRTGFGFSGG